MITQEKSTEENPRFTVYLDIAGKQKREFAAQLAGNKQFIQSFLGYIGDSPQQTYASLWMAESACSAASAAVCRQNHSRGLSVFCADSGGYIFAAGTCAALSHFSQPRFLSISKQRHPFYP